MASSSRPSGRYLLIALVWLIAVLGLSATGRLSALRPPVPQIVIVALTIALLLAGQFATGFRSWVAGIGIRQWVALHITRYVGIYFLVLYGRGELPYAFAVPGGWGDIAIASGALVLVLFVTDLPTRRPLLLTWNALGLLDLLFVVSTAARLAMADPASMAALLRLPLSIVPAFLVPILLSSHVWLFQRMSMSRSGESGPKSA